MNGPNKETWDKLKSFGLETVRDDLDIMHEDFYKSNTFKDMPEDEQRELQSRQKAVRDLLNP